MSVSYWLDKSASHKIVADVCVIGAGVAGLSTAFWLKKEDPNLKIVLVDKGNLASGATGRNAGFITCGSVEHFNRLVERWGRELAFEIWKFSEENLRLLKEHIIDDSRNLEFRHDGSFSLASTSEELGELSETAKLMESFGIEVESLDQDQVNKRLGVVNFVGGIKYLQDASIHPLRLVEKMLDKCPVEFLPNSEVFQVENIGEGTMQVKTEKCTIESAMVVMATNGYSSLVKSYFKDKIYPTRGQILATEPVAPFMEGACYANFVLDYFRQLADGRVLIGGFRQLEKESEVGYSDHITDTIQNSLQEFLQNYIPQLKGRKITHRWSGVMGFSQDGQPLVGSLPDEPQLFFVGGFTAHGLGLAFHSGKCLADLIYGRSIPDFISARRF